MESSCIEQLQSTQQSLCILRLVGQDLHPTVKSFLGKRKSCFVSRRLASKLMMMGYILPSRWQAVYIKAMRMDKSPPFPLDNVDSILSMLSVSNIDTATMKILDYWLYVL